MGNKNKTEEDQVPQGQIWFDNYFLWFGLSMMITAFMYTVWGLIETLNLPPAP